MGGKHCSAAFFLSLFVIFLFSLPFSLFAFSSSFYPVFGSSAEKEGEFEKKKNPEWVIVCRGSSHTQIHTARAQASWRRRYDGCAD